MRKITIVVEEGGFRATFEIPNAEALRISNNFEEESLAPGQSPVEFMIGANPDSNGRFYLMTTQPIYNEKRP